MQENIYVIGVDRLVETQTRRSQRRTETAHVISARSEQRKPKFHRADGALNITIASAILAGKEMLIFDEPTSGLDFRHMERTAELLSSLKVKQTVLIVTYDPELIRRCCDYIICIQDGMLFTTDWQKET